MKIAIISDSHDNIYNIEKFLDYAEKNKIEMIIHCGDLAAPSMLKNEFGPKFRGPFHFIHGNVADREVNEKVAKEFIQMTCHGDEGKLNIDGQRIGFCHYPDQAKVMAASGDYDLVFYGHNHKPWMETLENGCQLINPGTLAGLFNKATFSVYNTDSKEIELVLLEQI
ncbi:MAG: YfcE family phosphodiesterase [Patescibacteria group bacterium]|jgi:hypothetical protein